MKTLSVCLILVMSLLGLKAQNGNSFPYEKARDMVKEKYHIKKISDEIYVLANKDETQRYLAYNLPDDFKKDGLNVICSGIVGKVPPNFKMMGTPLKISTISVGKGYKKFNVKVRSYTL